MVRSDNTWLPPTLRRSRRPGTTGFWPSASTGNVGGFQLVRAQSPAAALVHELMEASLMDDRQTAQPGSGSWPASSGLLIIDELGFVPLSTTGAELALRGLQPEGRYERGSILVTDGNLPFGEDEPDRGLWLGKAHRGTAGPPHPPRAHPGDERRQLPPQGQPAECCRASASVGPAGSRLAPCQGRPRPRQARPPAPPARPRPSGITPVVQFCSAPVVRFAAALDNRSLPLLHVAIDVGHPRI